MAPVLDVVVPVHNEQADLEPCLRRLHAHLTEHLPYPFRITVAENASTDATVAVASRVAAELGDVDVLVLPEPGRGRALRTAWLRSDADVLVYMDVDLSTDLAALLPLVAPLISGHSDLAIGTRLSPSSRVVRGLKREVISRGYNPSPTLAQFQAYVESGRIHWFIGGGMGMGSDGGSSSASEIAAWVADTFTAQTVDGVTLYDLTQPAA